MGHASRVPTQVTTGVPVELCNYVAIYKLIVTPIPLSSTVRELSSLHCVHMNAVKAGETSKDGKRGFL